MTDRLDQALDALGIDADDLDPDVLDVLRNATPRTGPPMPDDTPPTLDDLFRVAAGKHPKPEPAPDPAPKPDTDDDRKA